MDVLQGKEDNYILPFFWQHGESKELNMRVWVLDDAHFPSGFCNGKIAPDSPYGKIYLT